MVLQVALDRVKGPGRTLPRHESRREFGNRLAGNDRLGTGPAVAGMDAVHLNRRLEAVALNDGLAALSAARFRADVLRVHLLGREAGFSRLQLLVARRFDAVAKPRDGDRSVGIMQGRHKLRHALCGVRRNAAVFAAVQVTVRRRQRDGEVVDAAKPRDNGRPQVSRSRRVAHQHHVRRKTLAELAVFQQLEQPDTSRLFLTIKENLEIYVFISVSLCLCI